MTITLFCEVDCVLLGAEGVCESGGIVNQLGTLPVALIAKQVGKKLVLFLIMFNLIMLKCLDIFTGGPQKISKWLSFVA